MNYPVWKLIKINLFIGHFLSGNDLFFHHIFNAILTICHIKCCTCITYLGFNELACYELYPQEMCVIIFWNSKAKRIYSKNQNRVTFITRNHGITSFSYQIWAYSKKFELFHAIGSLFSTKNSNAKTLKINNAESNMDFKSLFLYPIY